MTMPTLLLLVLIGMTIALIAVFVFRPQITQTQAGKIAAFLALFALPVLCAGMGASSELLHDAPIPAQRTGRANKDRKSTRLNSSHVENSYAVIFLKKKTI